MRNKKFVVFALAVAAGMLASCEKVALDAGTGTDPEQAEGVRVRFNVAEFEQVSFDSPSAASRAAASIGKVCSRVSFAFFKSDGNLYAAKHQTSDAAGFGTLDISLPPATYQVVALAHSGAGNPTFSAADSIRFPSNKVTDTFSQSQEITVDEGSAYNLKLRRVVAKFRLVIEDGMPAEVKRMKFAYTGGSSTLNAVTGYGRVNSRQTETRDVTDDMTGKATQFEVYTIPHAEEDILKMEVTALDAQGNTLYEKTFTNVPVQRNMITQYRGSFFGGSSGGDEGNLTIDLIVDDEWTEIDYCY